MVQPMDKPNAIQPLTPTTTSAQFPVHIPDFSMYKDGFDQILKNRGIRFMHHRAVPCPNMRSLDDNSHDPLCGECDGSGILYYSPKPITGVLVSNAIEKQFEYQGSWETGTAVLSMPTEYEDGEQADFTLWDRLDVLDYTVRLWEKKEYEPRQGLIQQLRYPIQKVQYLITASANSTKEYLQGVDFNITTDGFIQWVPGHQPSYDYVSEIGQVYSVAYYANPIYLVLQPMRELRVSQQLMPDGTKRSIRLPQNIVVKRDFLVNAPEKLASTRG